LYQFGGEREPALRLKRRGYDWERHVAVARRSSATARHDAGSWPTAASGRDLSNAVAILYAVRHICFAAASTLHDEQAMTDLPDRLSVNPKSPHYDEALLAQGVGIKFNGAEKTNVEEYCISEGWIRVTAGKSLDRYGNPMTIKLKGTVEPYLRNDAANQDAER
jgi:hypothetical protein